MKTITVLLILVAIVVVPLFAQTSTTIASGLKRVSTSGTNIIIADATIDSAAIANAWAQSHGYVFRTPGDSTRIDTNAFNRGVRTLPTYVNVSVAGGVTGRYYLQQTSSAKPASNAVVIPMRATTTKPKK